MGVLARVTLPPPNDPALKYRLVLDLASTGARQQAAELLAELGLDADVTLTMPLKEWEIHKLPPKEKRRTVVFRRQAQTP